MPRLNWNSLLCDDREGGTRRYSDEIRTEFERDYDRTLFATPVRRLQDKSQVFPLDPNDSIRTRLTHSLEVSCIARSLGFYVAPFVQQREEKVVGRSIQRDLEFICLTAGLVHDIGNPPFGHAGEKAIAGWFTQRFNAPGGPEALHTTLLADGEKRDTCQKVCDFERFEGNAQTLRIVTKLQLLDKFHGLNLTYGTLAAVIKYVAPSHQVSKASHIRKKPGYFWSEREIVSKIREKTGLHDCRHPLTFLVEAADDIAYSAIDIEDGLKKGIVSWETVKAGGKEMLAICEDAEKRVKESPVGTELSEKDKRDAYAVHFRTSAIGRFVPSAVQAFKDNYDPIMEGIFDTSLEKVCTKAALFKECKDFAEKNIYFASENLRLEIMGRRVIQDLMDLFWEGVSKCSPNLPAYDFPNKIFEIMSPNYRRVFLHETEGHSPRDNYRRFQLVTDYICGMTDTFACNLHRKLFNG